MPDGDGPPSPSLWSSLLSQVDKYCSDPIFVPPSRIAAPCPRTAPSRGSIRGGGGASEGPVRRSEDGPFGQPQTSDGGRRRNRHDVDSRWSIRSAPQRSDV